MSYTPPFARNSSNQLSTAQLDAEFTAFDARTAIFEGDPWRDKVACVAPGDISLAAPGATIDGVTMSNPMAIMLPAQTAPTEKGVYVWTGPAIALTRRPDSDSGKKLWAARYPVQFGTSAGHVFYNTNATIPLLGTDTPTFADLATVERAAVATLTNKNIVKRVVSTDSSATPTPNVDTTDIFELTALAAAATFGAPTGTPVDGQMILIEVKDNATPRALAWNAAYVRGGSALPTTTVTSKILTCLFKYTTANALNKWRLIAVDQEI